MKKTIADYPKLVKEWHPTKNGNLTPIDFSFGSNKKPWWICDKGHEWETACKSRTGVYETGCPYCSNHRVCKDNCLETLFPEVAKEWHPTKNGHEMPNNITSSCGRNFWWKCKKGHEWKATCNNRTGTYETGCPYCSNQKLCEDNCLATTHPELAKEWHPTKNGNMMPTDIITGTTKKIWWQCKKGHEWNVACDSRITNKTGCPYCSNNRVYKDNCLETLYPEVAKEWHPTKNGDVTPINIIAGSNKKFWWQCKKGHEWEAVCISRTLNKNCCPICNESRGEKEVARILEKLNIKYKREYRFKSCRNINPLPFDFVIWSNNKVKIIEYNGIQHYKPCVFNSKTTCKLKRFKELQHRDKIKKEWCINNNIPFLEVSYENYDKIEEIISSFLVL